MIRIPEYLERASRAVADAGLTPAPAAVCGSSIAPDSFKGSLDPIGRGDGPGRRLAPRPTRPTRSDSSRWPTAARARSRRSRRPRPTGSSCPSTRAIRSADRCARRSCAAATRASSSWRRRPACRALPPTSATRWPPRPSAPGQVLAAAIGLGVRDIVLGLGGSATTDGGAGLLVRARRALPRRRRGDDLPTGGGALGRAGSRRPDGRRAGTRRGAADGRLGRHQPAARASAARPRPTARRRAPTRSAGRAARREPGPLRRSARGGDRPRRSATCPAPARPAARRSACWRSPTDSRRSRSGPASRWSWS